MDMVRVTAHKRQTTGKSAARQIRREGRLPAVIYGKGDSTALTIEADTLTEIWHSAGGSNTVLDMSLLGDQEEMCHAILREVQINPVTREPLHVDFYRVDANEPIRVSVVVDTVNELPEELKMADTSASLVLREVDVECLPGNIPESIRVDLATLTAGHALHAGDLDLPEGVTLVTDADTAVVIVQTVRAAGEGAGMGDDETDTASAAAGTDEA
jgi:large subunit ribosomal protein L25